MTTERYLAAEEQHLGYLYLAGSFDDDKSTEAQTNAEYFDSKAEEWKLLDMRQAHLINNGGCMVKG